MSSVSSLAAMSFVSRPPREYSSGSQARNLQNSGRQGLESANGDVYTLVQYPAELSVRSKKPGSAAVWQGRVLFYNLVVGWERQGSGTGASCDVALATPH